MTVTSETSNIYNRIKLLPAIIITMRDPSQVGGVGLSDVVRGCLFSVHSADIRRVARAQQHQPEEDLLHRSRHGHLGVVGDSGQHRTSFGEPCVHGSPASPT